jgi:DNA polymerase-3 subunit epsilon
MSAIGITTIKNGKITDSFFSYVNPEVSFDVFNTQLTGINADTVRNSPTFMELWREIEPIMNSGILVAHNAVFDLSVLKACLNSYGITWKKSVKYLCTVTMGRKLLPDMKHNLNVMCEHYNIPLDHHKADSDSRACAEILLHYLNDGADEKQFIRTYKL